MNSIVVHYKELALKGRNRPWFIQQLVRNIKTALTGLGVISVRALVGRIEIELAPWADAVSELVIRPDVRAPQHWSGPGGRGG